MINDMEPAFRGLTALLEVRMVPFGGKAEKLLEGVKELLESTEVAVNAAVGDLKDLALEWLEEQAEAVAKAARELSDVGEEAKQFVEELGGGDLLKTLGAGLKAMLLQAKVRGPRRSICDCIAHAMPITARTIPTVILVSGGGGY